jgi:hypothetical protein
MRARATALAAAAALLASPSAVAQSFLDRFRDREDGAFDVSEYLLDHRGALVVPIVITEPAVGYGGGLAAAWFSESIRDSAQRASGGKVAPPNIYLAAAFATENGTRGGAAGTRLSFGEDRWRYVGGVAAMDVHLDFYGIGGNLAPGLDKLSYALEGWGTYHDLARRIGDSDHFAGLRYIYADMKTRFDAGLEGANLSPRELAKRNSELGFAWKYDSRDNIFTTRKGVEAELAATFASPSIGADNRFQYYRAHVFGYVAGGERLVVPLRADVRAARGDVPFYRLPFVDMRGIPAARYQDENAGVLEVEARYYVTPRWIVLGFLGAGRTWGRDVAFGDASSRVGKGGGFRYMIARMLNLSMGIDVARGPEDTAWYLQVGNAWR